MATKAYPVADTIRRRYSVRTYTDEAIAPEVMEKIRDYIKTLSNPFGVPVKIGMVRKDVDPNGEKLSTYGMIKGANTFLGVWVPNVPKGLLAAGYEFEDLILYLTSLGLGTVWIAGTLTREKFANALGVGKDDLMPAVSPVGYAAEKKRWLERLARKTFGADKRKPWDAIFFDGAIGTPLSTESAGRYGTALEMLRLAPSATNAQPWRVVKTGDTFDFYEVHKPGAKDAMIKQVDLGIALCHFVYTLESEGVGGEFVDRSGEVASNLPGDYHYVVSWRAKSLFPNIC